jgi:Zn finger protein HypA/HybF involved in hydrogenase expression
MLMQALSEAQAQDARRITELHLELFDPSSETEQALRGLVAELSTGTLAADAEVVIFLAPSRFICWNCCGLRFESQSAEAVCPNCGEMGMVIPPEVTFALDHVEVALGVGAQLPPWPSITASSRRPGRAERPRPRQNPAPALPGGSG